jgi:ppGpp synthetase/RelA/SpoT-type nucleotidyltranferase
MLTLKGAKKLMDAMRKGDIGWQIRDFERFRNGIGIVDGKKSRVKRFLSKALEDSSSMGVVKKELLYNAYDPRRDNQNTLVALITEGMYNLPPERLPWVTKSYAIYRELSGLDESSGTERLGKYAEILKPNHDSLIALLARACVAANLLVMKPGELAGFLNEAKDMENRMLSVWNECDTYAKEHLLPKGKLMHEFISDVLELKRSSSLDSSVSDIARRASEYASSHVDKIVSWTEARQMQKNMVLPAQRIYKSAAEYLGFLDLQRELDMICGYYTTRGMEKLGDIGFSNANEGILVYYSGLRETLIACDNVLRIAREVAEETGTGIFMVHGPRVKTIYSTIQKHARQMKNNGKNRADFFYGMHDAVAARIVTADTDDEKIKEFGRLLAKRIRKERPSYDVRIDDKLADKGYRAYHLDIDPLKENDNARSLYTLVFRFELQIRSLSMHRKAELGEGAHAIYKDSGLLGILPMDTLEAYREMLSLGVL